MVVEIFLSQGDGGDPLCDHGALVVNDEGGASGIGDGGVECIEEANFLGDLAQQQGAGVGGEPAGRPGSRRRRPWARGWKSGAVLRYSLSWQWPRTLRRWRVANPYPKIC